MASNFGDDHRAVDANGWNLGETPWDLPCHARHSEPDHRRVAKRWPCRCCRGRTGPRRLPSALHLARGGQLRHGFCHISLSWPRCWNQSDQANKTWNMLGTGLCSPRICRTATLIPKIHNTNLPTPGIQADKLLSYAIFKCLQVAP